MNNFNDDKHNNFKITAFNINTDNNIKIEKNNYFLLGQNIQSNENKIYKETENSCFGYIDNILIRVIDDALYYEGFEYIKIKQYYKKKSKGQ